MTEPGPRVTDNNWVLSRALAPAYHAHTATLRGVVRQHLVTRALRTHLPAPPGRILDVGGGDGTQAIALARDGYQVTICDPDPDMLGQASDSLLAEPAPVSARVSLVLGDGHDAATLVGDGWDATLCHGVLMYLPDPAPLLGVLVSLTRPGGTISLVGKNATALALRAGLQARWHEAVSLLDDETTGTEIGNLGVPSRGDDPLQIQDLLAAAGADPVIWHGIRVFTDHLGDTPPGPDLDTVLEAEWQAGRRDPYRQVARLYHLIHIRRS
ncbi:methyltransferase domain-containing protein [Frankia sp. CNm7]|uniref:Methyltransferase domain-containing protein n=1 Tax=Frankia nepalensis TaxID=1836974 RepID=A0A937RF38_9ACTN|nr:methyltransferase [Frankia nepalensis]MBL7497992.1 methyltransferase domain-containing protein [Frankia nepalensis]MBL7509074.1 methyltransferase domain-containing protein [Frankia nepalensis]MBL7516823.1 methyltransferase domain-containing protein [Frankia nepalensis]MBL7627820.1 methyltransferase domain-containing protein [Frankia nepalensis]